MAVSREPFGTDREGRNVEKLTLRRDGLEAEIITFGAALRALRVPRAPDRNGEPVDVVLGFDRVEDYEICGGYLGATVGRYANRIAGASCLIDGRRVALEANEGTKQLHGGPAGFSHRVFDVLETGESSVTLGYVSADGEGGFPGTLTLRVTCALDGRGLSLRYEAASDKTTFCNITNHSYFNLNGGGDAMGHALWLAAGRYTPIGDDSIPAAMSAPAAGTPFDFTAEKTLGRDIGADHPQLRCGGGYDHNFVLDPAQGLRPAARLTGDRSGIVMEVWTEKPGVQLYTANYVEEGRRGKNGAVYGFRHGFCLETQHFPDTPNQPAFPSATLHAGERYDQLTRFRFSLEKA